MPNRSTPLAIVLSTTATVEDAERIADRLIDEQLAACVQVDGPLTSTYRWQGVVERATEYRLVIKTTVDRWETLCERLVELHPYEEPQVMLLQVEDAAAGYQQWVLDQTSRPMRPPNSGG